MEENNRPVVDMQLGFTIRLSDSGEYVKSSIEIRDIHTDQNIDEQLEATQEAIDKTWNSMRDELLRRIRKLTK